MAGMNSLDYSAARINREAAIAEVLSSDNRQMKRPNRQIDYRIELSQIVRQTSDPNAYSSEREHGSPAAIAIMMTSMVIGEGSVMVLTV
jgi:hypothetical protein